MEIAFFVRVTSGGFNQMGLFSERDMSLYYRRSHRIRPDARTRMGSQST